MNILTQSPQNRNAQYIPYKGFVGKPKKETKDDIVRRLENVKTWADIRMNKSLRLKKQPKT
jgi:hypothetical protein